ncbi:MAG: DUF4168 domain-containing protein [Myxococcota bacterium]
MEFNKSQSRLASMGSTRLALIVLAVLVSLGTYACKSGSSQQEATAESEMTHPSNQTDSKEYKSTEEPAKQAPEEDTTQQAPSQAERKPAPAEQPATEESSSEGLDMPEDEFNEFVRTYREVARVQQTYQVRMQNAGSREEAKKLQGQAQQELRSVVDDSDLSESRFNALAARLQEDPEFRQKVAEELEEQGKSEN